MSTVVKHSSGFTKTGFSKNFFSCCSHWQRCQMGEGDCYHEQDDPEAKDYCRAYQRKHSENYKKPKNMDLFSMEERKIEEPEETKEELFQLSLF